MSRPDALAVGPREVPVEAPAKDRAKAPAAPAAAVPPRGASSNAKPLAAAPDRRAALPNATLAGSQPVLPAGNGFARLN